MMSNYIWGVFVAGNVTLMPLAYFHDKGIAEAFAKISRDTDIMGRFGYGAYRENVVVLKTDRMFPEP